MALLTALAWRIGRCRKTGDPGSCCSARSLGSQSAQDVFQKEGVQDSTSCRSTRSVFVSSPYASRWRRHWLRDLATMDPTAWSSRSGRRRSTRHWPTNGAGGAGDPPHPWRTPSPKVRAAVGGGGRLVAGGRRPSAGGPRTCVTGRSSRSCWWASTCLTPIMSFRDLRRVCPRLPQEHPEMIRQGFELPCDDAVMVQIERACANANSVGPNAASCSTISRTEKSPSGPSWATGASTTRSFRIWWHRASLPDDPYEVVPA